LNLVEAIVLGVVQGITEWLPISSNAHLKIIPSLLHWPDPGAAGVAVMQLGTMAAVLIYFFKRRIIPTLSGMVKAFQPGGDRTSPEARLGQAVLLGTLPICILGLALKNLIEGVFRSNYVIAGALIVMGIVLFAVEKFAKKERPLTGITIVDGVIVGLFQCLALIPGSSRSGSTLTGAYAIGLDREAAVEFSFLLSIPAVLLSGLFELKEFFKHEPPPPGAPPTMVWTVPDLIVATVVSGIVGYISIAWLMKYLEKHSTLVFVVYRVLLGLLMLYLLFTQQIAA
jgi:undecaprenyl-diphosphatase